MNPIFAMPISEPLLPIVNNSNVDPRDIYLSPTIFKSFTQPGKSAHSLAGTIMSMPLQGEKARIVVDEFIYGYKVLARAKGILSARGIFSVLTSEDDEISLEWENDNVCATFSYRNNEKNAYFTSYSDGKKVLSRKFIDISDFTENYETVL